MLVTAVVAHAQTNDIPGSLPNLQLSNQSPGEMTISWGTAVPFASDYRMVWAEESLPFLSYAEPNETGRGNEYPPGEARSITITNLTEGTTYKVRGRTRYTSGGENNEPWSGPWTNEITITLAGEPPEPPQQSSPTTLTARSVTYDTAILGWTAPDGPAVSEYHFSAELTTTRSQRLQRASPTPSTRTPPSMLAPPTATRFQPYTATARAHSPTRSAS